jgi:CRISPR-associated endonuclease Cas1
MATKNVSAVRQRAQTHTDTSQSPKPTAPIVPRHGTILLHGHVQISTNAGHLCVQDNFCGDIRQARYSRIGHNLERVYCIDGCGGYLSLPAIEWMASQRIPLTVLERSGEWLAISNPAVTSDAKLRRAQVMASDNEIGLKISRDLISKKLAGQERIARSLSLPGCIMAADSISQNRQALAYADTIDAVRLIESQAARSYWGAWERLPVTFPKSALPNIPLHWHAFGQRGSPLTGSPQRAVNPPNAMLNYTYAILLSECSIALGAVGLDPSLGYLHLDEAGRDSLACDCMEAVRPSVDDWLLRWLKGNVLRREWFRESRDGQCRLTSEICSLLSETASVWRREAVPLAEWVATTLGRGPARKTKQKAIKLKPPALCRTCAWPVLLHCLCVP